MPCLFESRSRKRWLTKVSLQTCVFLPSANEFAERLCFYTCLSFCPRGGGLSQCMLRYIPPWADTQVDTPTPNRRLLLWTVRILLECILVYCDSEWESSSQLFDVSWSPPKALFSNLACSFKGVIYVQHTTNTRIVCCACEYI